MSDNEGSPRGILDLWAKIGAIESDVATLKTRGGVSDKLQWEMNEKLTVAVTKLTQIAEFLEAGNKQFQEVKETFEKYGKRIEDLETWKAKHGMVGKVIAAIWGAIIGAAGVFALYLSIFYHATH